MSGFHSVRLSPVDCRYRGRSSTLRKRSIVSIRAVATRTSCLSWCGGMIDWSNHCPSHRYIFFSSQPGGEFPHTLTKRAVRCITRLFVHASGRTLVEPYLRVSQFLRQHMNQHFLNCMRGRFGLNEIFLVILGVIVLRVHPPLLRINPAQQTCPSEQKRISTVTQLVVLTMDKLAKSDQTN